MATCLILRRLTALALAMLMLVGCRAPQSPTNRKEERRELRVFAASSLTAALQAAKGPFEAMHPQYTLVLNFAGSNVLRTQIEQGADADLFFSAAKSEVDALMTAGKVASAAPFVSNELVIAVSREGAGKVRSTENLAADGIRLVVAEKSVPVGAYTEQFLERADRSGTFGAHFRERVQANVRSFQHNEQEVMAKVRLGEADAGIVYRSSLGQSSGAQEVGLVEIPPLYNVRADFYAAQLSGTSPGATELLHWLSLPQGQNLLKSYGFLPPNSDR